MKQAKTLSFGELIDSLKPGEIAYSLKLDSYITIADSGLFTECDATGVPFENRAIKLSKFFAEAVWSILPKYTTFANAMKAIEEGKDVECHFQNDVITVTSFNNRVGSICKRTSCESGGGASLKICYMVTDKWIIKEEEVING